VAKRGGQLLVDHFGYEYKQLRLLSTGSLSWKFLDHLLAINDVRVAVTLETQLKGWPLVEWRDEAAFRAAPDRVEITSSQGKKVVKPVLPDSYFCLQVPLGTARFFLELDRGTEPHHKFKPQIQIYQEYIESGKYQRRFHAQGVRILVVTSTQTRLENLKTTTAQVVGPHPNFWFTTQAQVSDESVLTAPIWQRLDRTGLEPLIGA